MENEHKLIIIIKSVLPIEKTSPQRCLRAIISMAGRLQCNLAFPSLPFPSGHRWTSGSDVARAEFSCLNLVLSLPGVSAVRPHPCVLLWASLTRRETGRGEPPALTMLRTPILSTSSARLPSHTSVVPMPGVQPTVTSQ